MTTHQELPVTDSTAFADALSQAPAIVRPRIEALRAEYQWGYDETPVVWPAIATRVDSSRATQVYRWLDPRSAAAFMSNTSIPVHSQTVTDQKFEMSVRVPVEALFSGEIGKYLPEMRKAGAAAKGLPDRLLAALIVENPVGFDGVPFFGAGHLIDHNYVEKGASYSNNRSTQIEPSLSAAHDFAISMENMTRGIHAEVIVIPERIAEHAPNFSTTIALPFPADHPYWYLIARLDSVLPFIWQDRTPATFAIFDQRDWMCHMGPVARGAVATTYPFLACRVLA